ncbi:MAG: enolase C-terminal domain-like protein [Chloroflexota bacterium]
MPSGSLIKSVSAREVFSGRGHPGVEATVVTANGGRGLAVATAGLSVGEHEVNFVYDGGARFAGHGVRTAVRNVNELFAPALRGMDATQQRRIDAVLDEMDPTPEKSRLGGNATASTSAAVLKAAAASLGLPLYQHIGGVNACVLPTPCVGAFGGCGRYGGGPAGSRTGDKPSQSFPLYGFDTFSEAAYAGWEIHRAFRRLLTERLGVGSEASGYAGIAPGMVQHDRELWQIMADAIEQAGCIGRAGIQIDVAAGTYWDPERQVFTGLFSKGDKTKDELIVLYRDLVRTLPVVILEDPLGEEDYEGHALLTRELGIQIVGDDLFTTNSRRLLQGIAVGGCNTMLLKVNQVGSITEAFDAVALAPRSGHAVMPCASRGEGDDLADYVVGLGTGQCREGASGSMANRYLAIEAELGARAEFLGKAGLKVDWSRIPW